METYILKSIACLFVLWGFYKLFLENLSHHHFKRGFLLFAVLCSLIIPSLVFTEYVPYEAPVISTVQPSDGVEMFIETPIMPAPATDMDTINWNLLLFTIYGLGVLLFGFRFLKNLYQILKRVRNNTKLKEKLVTKVLLQPLLPPHTFFNYIFLNKKQFEENRIPKEVLLHEEVHARQRHSLDVVLMEILQVVFWFNPMVYLIKNAVKLNHEFLADSEVIKKTQTPNHYQNTLLSYLSQESARKYQSVSMANAINYSSIKKRFKIMKKTSSKKALALRSALALPVVALLLFGFSETKTIQEQSTLDNILTIQNPVDKQFILLIANGEIILNGKKVPLNSFATTVDALTKSWEETEYTAIPVMANFSNTPLSFLKKVETEFQKTHFSKSNEGTRIFPDGYEKNIQEGASRKLMAEYNALAKKYNEMDRSKMRILKGDVERLEYIYSIMSDKQKADAEPFPDFPEPPQPPQPISIEKFHSPKSTQAPKTVKGTKTPTPQKTEAPKVVPSRKSVVPAPPQPPAPPKPNPLDHIIEMAKKDATFYYKRKEISADEAITLLKKNPDLSISTTKRNKERPVVKISKNL